MALATALAVAGLVALTAGCSSSGSTTSPPGTTAATRRSSGPAARHASGPSAGCRAGSPTTPGSTDNRLTSGGVERSYQLDVPPSYDGTKPYALVFGLHSLTVSYTVVSALSGFGDMNGTYDFIDVSPSGLVDPVPYWNAAPVSENDDVTFLGELLDHLEATLCIDTSRIFAAGMSNGAQMSSLLACRMPDRISAVAPIAGVEFNEPCDGAPVPIIAFHGAADPIVPYAGGGLNAVTIASQYLYKDGLPPGLSAPHGVDDAMKLWARHNGCDARPVEERISPEVHRRTWQNCKAATVLYVVDNGGHAWPGKPQPAFEASFGHGTTDIDATALMFAFFFGHRS
jgi:polyhydroxybutyrate depolymerase